VKANDLVAYDADTVMIATIVPPILMYVTIAGPESDKLLYWSVPAPDSVDIDIPVTSA